MEILGVTASYPKQGCFKISKSIVTVLYTDCQYCLLVASWTRGDGDGMEIQTLGPSPSLEFLESKDEPSHHCIIILFR